MFANERYFRSFCGLHRILWYFWDEDLFLGGEITQFRPEKTFEFLISAGKSLRISVKTFFFFGDHLSSAEKTFQFLIAAKKSLWIFGLYLVHLIQTGTNFSCPSPIHIIKLLVPSQNSFLPPQSRYPGAGLCEYFPRFFWFRQYGDQNGFENWKILVYSSVPFWKQEKLSLSFFFVWLIWLYVVNKVMLKIRNIAVYIFFCSYCSTLFNNQLKQ